jgi:hypothetical protein
VPVKSPWLGQDGSKWNGAYRAGGAPEIYAKASHKRVGDSWKVGKCQQISDPRIMG